MTRFRPSASPSTPPTRSAPAATTDASIRSASISGRSRTADWIEARPGEKTRGASPAARSARQLAMRVVSAPGSRSRSVRKVGIGGRRTCGC